MGYPSERRELEIFQAARRDPLIDVPSNVMQEQTLHQLSSMLDEIHISDQVARYVKRFIDRSRTAGELRLGISTRGGVLWLRMARALAILRDRNFVTPDDLQTLALPCLAHRVLAQANASSSEVIRSLLTQVDII